MIVPHRGERGPTAVAAVVLVLLAVFVAWPLAGILARSLTGPDGFTLEHLRALLGTWRLVGILLDTLAVAAVSTVATVAVALVVAWVVTRTGLPGRRLVAATSLLPLLSPPFLAALGLGLLFGSQGLVTRILGIEGSIDGVHGIVAAQVLTFLPHAYLRLAGALATGDTAQEEAGESLGAGPVTILRRLVLPQVSPALGPAALVVFVLCMADFGNPFLIGGRYPVLATEIYAQVVGQHDLAAAATTSMVLLVPCLLAHAASLAWGDWRWTEAVGTRVWPAPRPTAAALRWPAGTLAVSVALLVALVHAVVPAGSVVDAWGRDWRLSARHYAFASAAEGAWPLWNSVRLALASGVAGTGLALVVALLARRGRTPGGRVIAALALLPAAVPGTVVGVGYVLAFTGPPLALTGSFVALVASVVFWTLPVAVRAGNTALARLDPTMEEVAASLGAGRLRTLARVLLPLLRDPALWIFGQFFVQGMVTVGAVILLVYPGGTLASVAILARAADGDPGAACALGTLVLGAVMLAVLGLRWLGRWDRTAVASS